MQRSVRERPLGQRRNGSFFGFHSYHLHNSCAVASKVVAGGRVSYSNMQCDLVITIRTFPANGSLRWLFHVVPPWQVVIDKPHNIRKGVTRFLKILLGIENALNLARCNQQLFYVQRINSFCHFAQQWCETHISHFTK